MTAPTLEEVFAGAGRALCRVLTPSPLKEEEERRIAVSGLDRTDLLINYLRELLGLYNVGGFTAAGIEILGLYEHSLEAVLRGETFDPARHEAGTEVKAVTYHKAEVSKTARGWRARFILDI